MKIAFLIILFLNACYALCQKVDVGKLKPKENCVVVNRTLTPINDGSRSGASVDEREGNGIVWLNDVSFSSGTIEVDIRGKNKQGQSFVGIAFHGTGDDTYDAIYFRPFNFQSPDPDRKSHSVQYISMPGHDWSILRQQFPGKYENQLSDAVNPDDWFHARIQVEGGAISVFVNGAAEPSLVVHQLSERKSGRIGLWVGNGSGGDFANLTLASNP